MSVFQSGKFYHYEFFLEGRRHRGSTGTANKPQAIQEERRQVHERGATICSPYA